MDILTIATREANRAADAAQGNEAQAEAYRQTYTETLQRGRKAEEILEAGGIERTNGFYHVPSQSSGDSYVVNVEARDCGCPDHQQRETYCKHLQAAELYRETQSDPLQEANGEQVVLEVEGYARGRQLIDKRLARVRINGGSYREAKSENFDAALDWLMGQGYELAETVGPGYKMGTAKARYIYRKGSDGDHSTALPIDRPRHRDRLFKTA